MILPQDWGWPLLGRFGSDYWMKTNCQATPSQPPLGWGRSQITAQQLAGAPELFPPQSGEG